VTWTLNRLPVGAEEVTVDFEIGLTPGSAAAGNILPLTGDVTFEGEDASVGARIIRTAEAVDTALTGDPLGRGKGVVLPE
jgi:hypothetical protein